MSPSFFTPEEKKAIKEKTGLYLPESSDIATSVQFDRRPEAKIEIGEKTTITHETIILCHDASPTKIGLGAEFGNVKIGNNVFIGTRTIILGGTTIGDNSIIGAGSVVKGKIPPNEIWVGNPARFLKTIKQFKNERRNNRI